MTRAPSEAKQIAIVATSSGAFARAKGIRASVSACSSSAVMPHSAARAAALRASTPVRVTLGGFASMLM